MGESDLSGACSTSGSEAKCAHAQVLSCEAILGRRGAPRPGHFVFNGLRTLSKGSGPFECCTALDRIAFDERVFAPDPRNTVGHL